MPMALGKDQRLISVPMMSSGVDMAIRASLVFISLGFVSPLSRAPSVVISPGSFPGLSRRQC